MENKLFNVHGFHDPNPANNVIIEAGVPDSLIPLLERCSNSTLQDCNADITFYPQFPNTNTEKIIYV